MYAINMLKNLNTYNNRLQNVLFQMYEATKFVQEDLYFDTQRLITLLSRSLFVQVVQPFCQIILFELMFILNMNISVCHNSRFALIVESLIFHIFSVRRCRSSFLVFLQRLCFIAYSFPHIINFHSKMKHLHDPTLPTQLLHKYHSSLFSIRR